MRVTKMLILLLLLMFTSIQAQVAIIANKSVTTKSIRADELSEIYSLNKQRWNDGARIIVCDIKKTMEIKSQFYGFIHKSPYELRKIWIRAQLTGEARIPFAFNKEEEILKKVSETPGAIGYIDLAKVTTDVKILTKIE